MNKAFRKMCLHHQAPYGTKCLFHKEPDDVNTSFVHFNLLSFIFPFLI